MRDGLGVRWGTRASTEDIEAAVAAKEDPPDTAMRIID